MRKINLQEKRNSIKKIVLSDFARRVVGVVRDIPDGETMTYSEVAKLAGKPGAFRAVGPILAKYYRFCITMKMPTVPCHRVIRKNGDFGGYALGGEAKKVLLKKEMKKDD